MTRELLSGSLASAAIVILSTLGACDSQPGDDDERSQEELQALLHDEPLTRLPPAASSEARQATEAPATSSNFVPPDSNPLGAWSFDDCNVFGTALDEPFLDNRAFRSVGVTCTAGIENGHRWNGVVALAAGGQIGCRDHFVSEGTSRATITIRKAMRVKAARKIRPDAGCPVALVNQPTA